MMTGNGNVTCRLGHRHWGRYGAAGLLLRVPGPAPAVLLQRRSRHNHHGGTWALPGGARHRNETAVDAALAETEEETDLDCDAVFVDREFVDDHGGWSYTTVLATINEAVPVAGYGHETDEMRWVRLADVRRLRLHPDFAVTWPRLLQMCRR